MTRVLHSFTLIDGTGQPPVPNAALIMEGERIQAVGPRNQVEAPAEDAEQMDLSGCWAMPGLIDCHVHLPSSGPATARLEGGWGYTAALMLRNAQASLEAGFTTLRDVGGRHHLEFGIRRAIREGHWVGPRLYLAGKLLSITSAGTEHYDGMYREADGPDEVRRAAREQLKAGADLIKVMASGAVLTPGEEPGAPQYEVEEMRAAVQEAEKAGKLVAAHAHGARAIRNAVEAGARTIEHGTYLIEDPELMDRMAEEGVMLVPTLKVFHDMSTHEDEIPQWAMEKARRVHEVHVRSVRQARDRGVPIAMGTDAGTPYNYHGDNALELALMSELGLSPMQAIVAATRDAARALGCEDDLGTLEPGKLADVLVVRSDPLADLRSLTRKDAIAAVFLEGRQVVGKPG